MLYFVFLYTRKLHLFISPNHSLSKYDVIVLCTITMIELIVFSYNKVHNDDEEYLITLKQRIRAW